MPFVEQTFHSDDRAGDYLKFVSVDHRTHLNAIIYTPGVMKSAVTFTPGMAMALRDWLCEIYPRHEEPAQTVTETPERFVVRNREVFEATEEWVALFATTADAEVFAEYRNAEERS